MIFILILGILNVFKIWIIRFLPLLGDEAYYHLWSKYPALSYVDHPPMIAWLHRLVNLTFGQNDFGVRMGAILCLLISTWLIYLIGKEAFGKRVGLASAVLFNLIPTYLAGGIFLTPEQPLIIFWLLCIFFGVKIIKSQQGGYWYLLGIAFGFGLLSKFPMLLFPFGMLLFLLLSNENRQWLTKKEPYLALIPALLISSPVLIWNIQHGFPSLLQHGARLGSPDYLGNILYYLILQLLMYSPPLFIFACSTFFYVFWKKMKVLSNFSLFFSCLFLTNFFVFLAVSPFTMVGGHWTSTMYLGIIVMLCYRILSSIKQPFRTISIWANLAIVIFLSLLIISYYAFLYPIPDDLKGRAYSVNQELEQYVKEAKVDYVFSNQIGVASLAAFYGKTEAHMPEGRWKQFDIWGQPELKRGDDILYFAFNDPKMAKKLKPLFRRVKLDPQKRLFIKDSDISILTQVIHCIDFQGGSLP
jgi:4-amino-4-deoxy-L-arabinose transferase-like glycosyltransferase